MPSRPTGMWTRLEVFMNGPKSKEWSNIFWFKQSGAPTVGNMPTDTTTLGDSVANQLITVMPTVVSVVGYQAVFNNGAGAYGCEDYTTIVGTLPNDSVPEDVSAVVQRLTATAGKSGRGRIFIAGIDNSLVQGSYLSSAGFSAFNALATALQPVVTGVSVNYTPYFFSPKTGAFLAINSWVAIDLLATNRKRRPRF